MPKLLSKLRLPNFFCLVTLNYKASNEWIIVNGGLEKYGWKRK
jgi:hypothetical protein